MTLPDEGELLTIGQVAKSYGVSEETIRRWIRKGVIHCIHVGPYRLVRVRRAEAEKHLAGAGETCVQKSPDVSPVSNVSSTSGPDLV
jgi:excisionase family DNA binding protein